MKYVYLPSVATLSLCHSGHLTEGLHTGAPPLVPIQSLLSPSLLAPTLALQAGPDPVPGPKADQGILLSFFVCVYFILFFLPLNYSHNILHLLCCLKSEPLVLTCNAHITARPILDF